MNALMFVGAAILSLLLALLASTLLQLRTQRAEQARNAEALAAHNQQAHEARLKSLEMISLATLAGDCELSEGCLRARALLEDYPGLRDDVAFAAIDQLFQEIRGFAVADARRALREAEIVSR